jgi:hypothetical protein
VVRLRDKFDQVVAASEARIDLEEILNTVAVAGIKMPVLAEDWAQQTVVTPNLWR